MTRRISVFARAPVPGQVKTRLAPALTPAFACELHRAMYVDTLRAVAGAPADERWVHVSDATDQEASALVPDGFRSDIQRGADLGGRLTAAFSELLVAPADRAVIVGADSPELRSVHLERALDLLEHADVVLGPARDGGYYLVALTRAMPELFRGIEWSTPRVLAQTLDRIVSARARVAMLEPLEDVDTAEDLMRVLAREVAGRHRAADATITALRRMALLPG